MSRPRILHLRSSNFVGGPERQILRYAEYERTGDFEVILGVFVGPQEGRQFLQAAEERGFRKVSLPSGGLDDLRALFALRRFLSEQKVALLCTHGYKADLLGTAAAQPLGIPVAWFLRGWTGEDPKVRVYEALDRTFLPLARRVVCLSKTQARSIGRRKGVLDKIRIVHNAVDVTEVGAEDRERIRRHLRERLGLPAGCTVVATAGRLSPEKGVVHFLEAVACLSPRAYTTAFVVMGDGPEEARLKARARELGIEGAVRFAGFVPDFPQLAAGLDMVVNPSLTEVMPNVVLEAMGTEVPLVATDVGAVAEMAGEPCSVALVPPGDAPALAAAIDDLLQHPEQARAMARRARERVERVYSPSRQCSQIRELYEELIPSGSEKRAPAGHPALEGESVPLVSVVIPVRNEEKHIGALLDDLLHQNYPPDRFEILVADGESTDGTGDVVRRYAATSAVRIETLPNPGRLSSAGRNVGARNSRGEFVIFIDGHCRVPSQMLLQDTVGLFRQTEADCLCRPQPLQSPENTWMQQVIARVRTSTLGHGSDSTIYATSGDRFVEPMSSGASYRRKVFEQVGYYDESFDACEDVEFNYRVHRADLTSYWSSRLAVQYSPRKSLGGLWKQMMRYGRGRHRLLRKHPEAATLAQLVPAAFLAWLLVGGLASIASQGVRIAYFASLIVYALLVVGCSAWLAVKHGWSYLGASPLTYFTIHAGLGAGWWAELFQGVPNLQSAQRLQAGRNASGAIPTRDHGRPTPGGWEGVRK